MPPDVRDDLDIADREVARVEGMIDDLFTLSRAEVGRLELRLAPTDIGALVRSQVETQSPLAWRKRRRGSWLTLPTQATPDSVRHRRSKP